MLMCILLLYVESLVTNVQIDRMIEMLMTTLEMSASDTARQWVVAPNVTKAIDGLKHTIDIDRMIEMLNATVAMTVMNTECDDCKKNGRWCWLWRHLWHSR